LLKIVGIMTVQAKQHVKLHLGVMHAVGIHGENSVWKKAAGIMQQMQPVLLLIQVDVSGRQIQEWVGRQDGARMH